MLRRDEDALDLDRRLAPVLVDLVADGDLCLAVGPQVRQLAGLAHLREPLADPVREHDRQRHQLRRLVRRVAEHHPLVARAEPVERVDVAGSCCTSYDESTPCAMSGDCSSIATTTPHVSASKPYSECV